MHKFSFFKKFSGWNAKSVFSVILPSTEKNKAWEDFAESIGMSVDDAMKIYYHSESIAR